MNLDRVTITGADDSVHVSSLRNLSDRFPFVEWGILVSYSQAGGPRFPSGQWLKELHRERGDIKLSMHLCGRWLRELLGGIPVPRIIPPIFKRIQLNFHGEEQVVGDGFVDALSLAAVEEAIFQIDGAMGATIMDYARTGRSASRPPISCVPLFDLSHGAGVLPKAWPRPIDDRFYQGYAGGLGPDNLEEQIKAIGAAAGEARFWIDMETKVRSHQDRTFDLAKVERCLAIAEPFVVVKS